MRLLGFSVLMLLMSACSAQPKEGELDSARTVLTPCKISEQGPSQVLVGTDVQSKESFKQGKAEQERYKAEIGGATVEVDLSVIGQLVRIYRETGMPEIVKAYSELCSDGRVLASENIQVLFVEDGILLWEQEVGDAMLPTDLWVYLKKD